MKKKNVLEIIGGILVLAGVIILCIAYPFLRGDKTKNNNNKTKKGYDLIENYEYEFLESYEDYLNFIEEYDVTKYDYYKALTRKDFKNQAYLFVVVPFDPCSEDITNEDIELDGNKYKVYLDVEYNCGVCPLERKIMAFKVDKIDTKVKVYSKEVSREECDPNVAYKPIIYIYPDKDMDLTITLGNPNNLLYTYPKYINNWNVHVTTDGNIYDYNTGRNYYGLYWEANDNYKLDMSKGFVVKGEDTVKFLEEKLAILGLNDYEINEFIIYWIDKLENNNYNFISFRSLEDINNSMPLIISEEPDTLIRVMMDYKPLDNYIEVKEQELIPVNRNGYTVVEWGGTKH